MTRRNIRRHRKLANFRRIILGIFLEWFLFHVREPYKMATECGKGKITTDGVLIKAIGNSAIRATFPQPEAGFQPPMSGKDNMNSDLR